jgi:alpha-D-xyloside xylohydrolase
MKPGATYLEAILDLDAPDADRRVAWRAMRPADARAEDGDLLLDVPFAAWGRDLPRQARTVRVRAYARGIVRLSLAADGADLPGHDSPMLEMSPDLAPVPLSLAETSEGWAALDPQGRPRARVRLAPHPVRPWSQLIPAPEPALELTLLPDCERAVELHAYDQFFPALPESFGLGWLEDDGEPVATLLSLRAEPDERFAGTGERFAKMDLSGQTMVLENLDAAGANSRRAYKNVPFWLSSRGFGALLLTSATVRLSLADVSRRAAVARVEEPALDLWLIGGGHPERALGAYRALTGAPGMPPVWSFGAWMARMTYLSRDEVEGVARRLRREEFPCDVIHLDTGWFERDWICDWEFGPSRFPEPRAFLERLRREGFRVSLWQFPFVAAGAKWFDHALDRGFAARRPATAKSASAFGPVPDGRSIDFTNPEAVAWYQGLLTDLIELGASCIKTDFGENVDMDAAYAGMPARLLRNLYALLYQRAAFEATERATGEGIVWARAGWTGCQRYPVHWGGDASATWDGMAQSLRGGLHLGLSGFAFWSHDVPGFHGLPDFMNSPPDEELFVRWTQFGALSSHLRFHGAHPREPWEYPAIAPVLRDWLRIRYALVPYLVDQARECVAGGAPMLRAMCLADPRDPVCWTLDDQYLLGSAFLVAPVMRPGGVRDVYLPSGRWVDVWTGASNEGPVWLRDVRSELAGMPWFAREGARVRTLPTPVPCTDAIRWDEVREVAFDAGYSGIRAWAPVA